MLTLTKNYFIKNNSPSEILNIFENVTEKLTKSKIKHNLKIIKDETYILKIKIKCDE